MRERFKDKVMIVTGAAGGIGKSVAVMAAKEGAKLVLADRKQDMSMETLAEIKAINPNVEFIVGDLREPEVNKKVVDTAVEKFGGIDILINNAGILGIPDMVHDMSEEMFRNVMECNLMTYFHLSHFAMPVMIKGGKGGAVVNVGSTSGMVGFPAHCAYVSSKHAVGGLTRSMALDYPQYGIRVNAVMPGSINTPLQLDVKAYFGELASKGIDPYKTHFMTGGKLAGPMKRAGEPDEVANVILFLASDEASYVNGVLMPVDGGFTIF